MAHSTQENRAIPTTVSTASPLITNPVGQKQPDLVAHVQGLLGTQPPKRPAATTTSAVGSNPAVGFTPEPNPSVDVSAPTENRVEVAPPDEGILDSIVGSSASASAATLSSADARIKELEADLAAREATTDQAQDDIVDNLQALPSEADTRRELEERAGINDALETSKGLRDQIASATASLERGLIDEEGRPIPMKFITGRQREMVQLGTARVNALTGQLAALNGNIDDAVAAIDREVEALFADADRDIEIKKFQLEIASSREDREAGKLDDAISEQESSIAIAKEEYAQARAALYDAAPFMDASTYSNLSNKLMKGQISLDEVLTAIQPSIRAAELSSGSSSSSSIVSGIEGFSESDQAWIEKQTKTTQAKLQAYSESELRAVAKNLALSITSSNRDKSDKFFGKSSDARQTTLESIGSATMAAQAKKAGRPLTPDQSEQLLRLFQEEVKNLSNRDIRKG